MDLANMQDSKKTIIAFAAGLLIGALLVWAFMAATPAEDRENNVNDDDNGLVGNNTNRDDDDDNTSSTNGSRNDDDTETFSIDDQPAGNTVELGNIDFPEGTG
jgi:cytoskeletal protein RodZ